MAPHNLSPGSPFEISSRNHGVQHVTLSRPVLSRPVLLTSRLMSPAARNRRQAIEVVVNGKLSPRNIILSMGVTSSKSDESVFASIMLPLPSWSVIVSAVIASLLEAAGVCR